MPRNLHSVGLNTKATRELHRPHILKCGLLSHIKRKYIFADGFALGVFILSSATCIFIVGLPLRVRLSQPTRIVSSCSNHIRANRINLHLNHTKSRIPQLCVDWLRNKPTFEGRSVHCCETPPFRLFARVAQTIHARKPGKLKNVAVRLVPCIFTVGPALRISLWAWRLAFSLWARRLAFSVWVWHFAFSLWAWFLAFLRCVWRIGNFISGGNRLIATSKNWFQGHMV